MALFRKIHVRFWNDSFVSELTPEKKFFFIYLLTNENTTACGIYEITKRKMSFETGYTVETIDKLLSYFQECGKVLYSQESNEICILNWNKYNENKSPKIQALLIDELKKVKNKALIKYLYPENTVSIQYPYSIDATSPKDQDQDIDQDQEQEKDQEKNGVVENQLSAYFPLEFAFSCWLKIFPNYPKDIKKDYPALRSIVEHISKKQPAQLSKDELSNLILDFAKKVSKNAFYKDKSLSTVSNKIQDILLASNNNNTNQAFKPQQRSILDSGFSHNDYLEYAKENNL